MAAMVAVFNRSGGPDRTDRVLQIRTDRKPATLAEKALDI
jgi:hypothetical protein